MRLKVYGCRGSTPVSYIKPSKYGGNTSCVKLTSGDRALILDAGSGLLLMDQVQRPVNILLGHLHMDHTCGLLSYPPIWDKEGGVHIYTRDRTGQEMKTQVFGGYRPPYWPVPMEKISQATVTAIREDVPFSPDGVFTVTPFAANHPDGTDSFKITNGHKTLIYMADCEIGTMSAAEYEMIVSRCRGADFIICEATYHPDDYTVKRGWGHSTLTQAVQLANDSRCKRMMFAHYSYDYTDQDLDSWAELLEDEQDKERFIFSRDGLELEI
jgi:ribonuclease BN (tRNA processing enzyme)